MAEYFSKRDREKRNSKLVKRKRKKNVKGKTPLAMETHLLR
jgi:hypothetical protein